MPNFWTFRDHNEIIYIIVDDEDKISKNATKYLAGLLSTSTPLTVYKPNGRDVAFVLTPDWSKLTSVMIQTKKTLDQRSGRNGERRDPNAKIHVKCYFDIPYAQLHFKGMDIKKVNEFFNLMAKWHDDNEMAPRDKPGFLFNQPKVTTIAVDHIANSISSMPPGMPLPATKNIYIYETSFYNALVEQKSKGI